MTKTSTRIGATVAALALATGAALAGAAPATAATTVGQVTWYGPTDFGLETTSYPTGVDWFFGAPKSGEALFTANGLEITTDAGELVQILNQDIETTFAGAAEFVDYLETVRVFADGDWWLQVPLFGESGSTAFATLRPVASNTEASGADQWEATGAVGSIPAGTPDTLDNFATQLYAGTPPTLLALGLYVAAEEETTVVGFEIDGAFSAFTPVVTRTISPNPVTPAQATTTGIRFQGSGWLPGSIVYIEIFLCDAEIGTESLFLSEDTVAAEDGTVDFTAVLATAPAVGTYCVWFDDDSDEGDPFYGLDGMPQLQLEVKNVLPATGLEVTAPLVGGIAFLVIGGLTLAVTRKVERNSHA